MLPQNPRPAALRLFSVLAPTCVCLNAGSAMETRTVLMELMRVLKLVAVSGKVTPWKVYRLCVVNEEL